MSKWTPEQRKKYDKKYFATHRVEHKAARKRNRDRIKQWFRELKATLRCLRCPEDHPACLQFHHRPGTIKVMEVSILVTQASGRAKILEEIAKCDVLCANCHMKLHFGGVEKSGISGVS